MIPDTVLNMEHSQIMVEAEATNGCWSDLYIELSKIKDFEYSVKAYGTYEGCGTCPDIMIIKDTIFDFQPTQKGTYLFKISERTDKIFVDTIIVK